MKKLLLAAVASLAIAAPASAAELGIAFGTGGTNSSSTAVAGSQGSSGSVLFGVTAQQSSAGANSNGTAEQVIQGNDSGSQTTHTSTTTQQGSTFSFGLAGSQNSNIAFGAGQSNAGNNIAGVWLFANP